MKQKNVKAMESLSVITHFCGLINILLGLMIIGMDFIDKETKHIPVGIFIFITGYAFVKISSKLSTILLEEKLNKEYN